MSSTTLAHTQITTTAFEPFLVEGRAFGEVHWLRREGSEGRLLLTGLWRHPQGSFDYTFPADETLHVLTGRVQIRLREGGSLDLQPGDLASFPKGAASHWTITEPLLKFFVISG